MSTPSKFCALTMAASCVTTASTRSKQVSQQSFTSPAQLPPIPAPPNDSSTLTPVPCQAWIKSGLSLFSQVAGVAIWQVGLHTFLAAFQLYETANEMINLV